jgi:hypothetical protein
MSQCFAEDRDAFFAVMQSQVHETWARFFSSTLEDRLNYMPSDCFETFPFPQGWETDATLAALGQRYHQHRADLMRRTVGTKRPEGLTATYNRFHDPNEHDPNLVTLRDLHAQLDRAVLNAYGWNDLQPVYDFRVQLDTRVRWTWDEATRDEVLARLLEENRVRAAAAAAASAAAQRAAAAGQRAAGAATGRRKKGAAGGEMQLPLPGGGSREVE